MKKESFSEMVEDFLFILSSSLIFIGIFILALLPFFIAIRYPEDFVLFPNVYGYIGWIFAGILLFFVRASLKSDREKGK